MDIQESDGWFRYERDSVATRGNKVYTRENVFYTREPVVYERHQGLYESKTPVNERE